MHLKLHDTLTGQLRPLEPRQPGKVGVYCCGPTTYDVAHVGHARAALAPDVLVRYLRLLGLEVKYVRNVTDVDDKILNRAKESGEPPMQLSARMAKLYQDDMQKLGCVAPDVEPKVSEHIDAIVTLVAQLIEHGAAYAVDMPGGTRDVYYAVRNFAGYGKLSKRRIEELQVGARIEANEQKRDPLDFALWKGCREEDWGWPSPWGKGRPGWHIECSAMSSTYLGHNFDVHTGGMDLVFPHHENEIAQSEAAHPAEGDFVRLWIHNGFVNVDKEKMAKSLGNFVTVRDVYDRYDPEGLRYFLLGVHYRGPIAFETEKLASGRVVFPGIAEAERRVDYLYATVERLTELSKPVEPGRSSNVAEAATLPKELGSTLGVLMRAPMKLREALDDDLNTPAALAVVAELASSANELCDLAQKKRKEARFVDPAQVLAARALAALREAFQALGLVQSAPADYRARTQARRLAALGVTPETIEGKIAERDAARKAKDFARADVLRGELAALGVDIADSPQGTRWHVTVS